MTVPARPIVVPPEIIAVAPVRTQRADRSVRTRARWLAASGGCLLGACAWPLVWVKLLGLGVGWEYGAALGLPAELVWLAGVGYFGLALADEVERFRIWHATAWQEVWLRRVTVETSTKRARTHADRWYGRPHRPAITINGQTPASRLQTVEQTLAQQAAILAALSAMRGGTPGPRPPVDSPGAIPKPARPSGHYSASQDQTTQTLPDAARLPAHPPRVRYRGTPLEAIMTVLWRDGKVGQGTSALDRATYAEACRRLQEAGVLHLPAKGRGPQCTPAFAADCAGRGIDAQHDMVETYLARGAEHRTEEN